MSLSLIIISLLVWLALPPVITPSMTPARAALTARVCRWAAVALLVCALLYQYL